MALSHSARSAAHHLRYRDRLSEIRQVPLVPSLDLSQNRIRIAGDRFGSFAGVNDSDLLHCHRVGGVSLANCTVKLVDGIRWRGCPDISSQRFSTLQSVRIHVRSAATSGFTRTRTRALASGIFSRRNISARKVSNLSSRMGSSVPSRSCPPRTPREAWPALSCWHWR